jgi:hypothetical protein
LGFGIETRNFHAEALQADLGIAGAGRHLVEAALKLFFVREIVE